VCCFYSKFYNAHHRYAGCGGTYVMEIVTMYLGGRWYWGQVVVLVITAIASLTTSAVLGEALLRPHKWVRQDGF